MKYIKSVRNFDILLTKLRSVLLTSGPKYVGAYTRGEAYFSFILRKLWRLLVLETELFLLNFTKIVEVVNTRKMAHTRDFTIHKSQKNVLIKVY